MPDESDRVEILLVEDNDADMELALYALKQGKVVSRIHVARDGEEALDFLFCRGAYGGRSFAMPPRLVLLDLKLPKVHGLEVLRTLKSDPRTSAIPIVILTTSDEEPDVVEGYRGGVNSYIQKPLDYSHFREVVKQLGLYWLNTNVEAPSRTFRGD
jgi:two-component system, response regulator